ncbi:MAG: reprolysin-like metallopeptidase [Fimbriimonadaceae bacterium]
MRTCILLTACLAITGASAQDIFVRSAFQVDESGHPALPWVTSYDQYKINAAQLKDFLATVPLHDVRGLTRFKVMELPTPDGKTVRVKIAESPIMSSREAARINIKTFKVWGIDDPFMSGRLDYGVNGFHGLVYSSKGAFVIDPPKIGDVSKVVTYYRADNYHPKGMTCFTRPASPLERIGRGSSGVQILASGTSLKTYRLAMNATGEYTAFFGSIPTAEAAMATTINRLNQVYEVDFSLTMSAIRIKAYQGADSDPYTGTDVFAMLQENQNVCDSDIGDANYDVGHVMTTGSGGVAGGIPVVGITGQKAKGATGWDHPFDDEFDIDYVAHELGHQFGGEHTFFDCGGGNAGDSAYEPGSATTIMGYAGICGAASNIQPHSDPYFHAFNQEQINVWRNNAGSGGSETANGNALPTANAGLDVTVPQSTPMKLRGVGTDANNDPLTYCWEQYDNGFGGNPTPIFRSVNPSPNKNRFLPKLATVLSGGTDKWEPLITSDRIANFRLTVRDNRPGGGAYAFDDMKVTVSGAPFKVTSPNTNITANGGGALNVTWDVGGSGGTAKVNILLSTDGGSSYENDTATVLLAGTNNDGAATVTLPNVNTTSARIIVEGASNVFYDISDSVFKIIPINQPPLDSVAFATGQVVGGFSINGTVTLSSGAIGQADVALSSNSPKLLPPATATVANGQTVGNFSANTATTTSEVIATLTATLGSSTRTASITIVPSVQLDSVTVTPQIIGGGANAIGRVNLRNICPPGGAVINLSDGGATDVTVPQYVIIAGNTMGNTFTVLTKAVAANTNRTITASLGTTSVTFPITLVPFNIVSIATPSGIVGGNAISTTITMNAPAPSGGLTLNRNYLVNNGVAVNAPANVVVPAGSASVTFNVGTAGVAEKTNVKYGYTYAITGSQIKSTWISILPADLQFLTITPRTVEGNTSTTGTVVANGKAAAGFVVNLSSNGPEVIVPATVTIPAQQNSATFTVQTTNPANSVTRIVTATRNGRTRTATVVVVRH